MLPSKVENTNKFLWNNSCQVLNVKYEMREHSGLFHMTFEFAPQKEEGKGGGEPAFEDFGLSLQSDFQIYIFCVRVTF